MTQANRKLLDEIWDKIEAATLLLEDEELRTEGDTTKGNNALAVASHHLKQALQAISSLPQPERSNSQVTGTEYKTLSVATRNWQTGAND